jgi:hypothetical protein
METAVSFRQSAVSIGSQGMSANRWDVIRGTGKHPRKRLRQIEPVYWHPMTDS